MAASAGQSAVSMLASTGSEPDSTRSPSSSNCNCRREALATSGPVGSTLSSCRGGHRKVTVDGRSCRRSSCAPNHRLSQSPRRGIFFLWGNRVHSIVKVVKRYFQSIHRSLLVLLSPCARGAAEKATRSAMVTPVLVSKVFAPSAGSLGTCTANAY